MKVHWIEKTGDLRTCCGRSVYDRGIKVSIGAPKRKRKWECPECRDRVWREPIKKRTPRVRDRRKAPRP